MDQTSSILKDDPTQHARHLQAELDALLARIRDDVAITTSRWATNKDHPHSNPANLAAYLALRRRDLRHLQGELVQLGLSSLGRSEAHVIASLEAVLASLSRIAGPGGSDFPPMNEFITGRSAIAQRQAAIFGPAPHGPYTRIMVTLPSEAADDTELLNCIVSNGADCVRINCAHDGPDAWMKMIRNTQAAARAAGRRVPVAMDLGGPKIRLTQVKCEDKARLFIGDRFVLTSAIDEDEKLPQACLSHHQILAALKTDSVISINDGKISARVIISNGERAILQVTQAREKGEKLKPEKGFNVPDLDLDIPALTEKDIADLDFVSKHADIIGFSFVQTTADVDTLVAELMTRRAGQPLPALILKIETPLAIRNLPELIVAASASVPTAVMIARGDLAVEIGLERLSEMQEEILWLCEAAHIPVVWATQVLESLIKDGLASRAEITDAAMGQRAECVMLNKGPNLVKAVGFLDQVLRRMDRHQAKKSAQLAPLKSW